MIGIGDRDMNAINTVGIVSLSSGILGEDFLQRQRELGVKRLEEMGLRVKFMPNALRGVDYLDAHPEARAADLLEAYRDSGTDLILCAIGGDDTYRLLPYLFGSGELAGVVNDKPFLGFSDTTTNHFMLRKVGGRCFYGQSFIPDLCEQSDAMLPYSRKYFEQLVRTGTISEITPSDVWYESRRSFGVEQFGHPLVSHPDRGFELLQGSGVFSGEILGGCIESMHEMFDGWRHEDMPVLCGQYGLFPAPDEWRGKILLLESSEEKMPPDRYAKALHVIKDTGVFSAVSGVIVGKPMDEAYDDDYRCLLCDIIGDRSLPVVWNINTGHSLPHCIIPLGVPAVVNAAEQKITFQQEIN